MQEPPRFQDQLQPPRFPQKQQYQKFERLQTLRERPWRYRHPTLFVALCTILGCSITLSPLIYSLTHTEEEQRALKESMGMKIRRDRQF